MFHKLRSIYKIFYKRTRALFRYICDYKILLLSIVYVISISVAFKILRNIVDWRTMGLFGLSSFLLLLVFPMLTYLRNILKERGGLASEKKSKQRRDHFFITISLCLLTASLAFVKAGLIVSRFNDTEQSISGFTNEGVSLEGYVYDEPNRKHRYQHIKVALLGDILVDGEILGRSHGYILIKTENYEKFQVGQVCKFRGTLVEPESFDEFDYKQYLRNNNIFLIMEDPFFICSDTSKRRGGNDMKNYLIDLKENIVEKVDIALQEPQSSLLVGILLGKRRLFSDKFDKSVRMAGVSHIVSASGYNITILVLVLNKTLFFLPKKIRIILGLIVIWLFAIFSGLSSSIVRACIMSSFSHLALLSGRNNTIHITLPLASAIFVLFDPLIIYDIGFLLSVSATLGLIYLLPILISVKEKLVKGFKFFEDYIFPTMSCTIATLPVSMLTFKTFSIWSVPVNAVILPVVEGTMLWGVLSLLVSGIHKPLSFFFLSIANLQLKYFEYIVEVVGKLNIGSWEITDQKATLISSVLLFIIVLLVIYHYPVENEKYNYYLKNR